MWLGGLFGKKGTQNAEAGEAAQKEEGEEMDTTDTSQGPTLRRGTDGRLRPERHAAADTEQGEVRTSPDAGQTDAAQADKETRSTATPQKPLRAAPDTSALNKQVVQAVQFTNTETSDYATEVVATPPEMMVSNTTGLAIQDAANYMNGIMQIALAAQAVAIKKAAEGPVQAAEEIPLMAEIQKMVTAAVSVYGNVSSTAGTSAKTVISDLKSG